MGRPGTPIVVYLLMQYLKYRATFYAREKKALLPMVQETATFPMRH
jgi:hypothetical protein